jgi:hypothetical protein
VCFNVIFLLTVSLILFQLGFHRAVPVSHRLPARMAPAFPGSSLLAWTFSYFSALHTRGNRGKYEKFLPFYFWIRKSNNRTALQKQQYVFGV